MRIHVSATDDRRSLTEVAVHRPRSLQATRHNGLPLTTVARTLLDLAATMQFADLRRVLAEADHAGRLEEAAVLAQLGRGRHGSTALREALAAHLPELARAFSVLEERFLALIDDAGIPLPEVNVFVEGFKVDCLWRPARVVVELDGHETHDRTAAIERDRHRELILRGAGYSVLRYTWQQVTRERPALIADLTTALSLPSPSEPIGRSVD